MPGFTTGKVTSITRPASTYIDLVFATEVPLVFEPGQFISIRVNERDIRSYSLAGKVGDSSYGIIVDVKPGGPGSKFFDTLKVNDTFSFLGPLGKFVFNPADGAQEILFLATGSGIAPLKAMLEKAFSLGDTRPMTLYFGLRYTTDIYWDSYFNALQDAHPNFKFVLCLSQPDEKWTGVTGHITDLLAVNHPGIAKASCYLCGNGKMIQEGAELLAKLGMPKERVYFEKFF